MQSIKDGGRGRMPSCIISYLLPLDRPFGFSCGRSIRLFLLLYPSSGGIEWSKAEKRFWVIGYGWLGDGKEKEK